MLVYAYWFLCVCVCVVIFVTFLKLALYMWCFLRLVDGIYYGRIAIVLLEYSSPCLCLCVC